jgi:glycerate kinase
MKKKIKVVIAPNAFKGTLSSVQAAKCIERGLKYAWNELQTKCVPVADGGDSTLETIIENTGGQIIELPVLDPLGRTIKGKFGIIQNGQTAIIESAIASGLVLLSTDERNPLITSTFGTGQLLREAILHSPKKIIVGVGGTATNDAGTGMARALGVNFYDRYGNPLPEGGGALVHLARIDTANIITKANIEIIAACDVNNPLIGEHGASKIYAPQKGADIKMVEILEQGLINFCKVVLHDCNVDIANIPGAGAGGGLAGGLKVFLNAQLASGIETVMELINFHDKLQEADLVITGEGRIDLQTLHGKAPSVIAMVAKKMGVPVVAICGIKDIGVDQMFSAGFDACIALSKQIPEERGDMKLKSAERLTECAKTLGKVLKKLGGISCERIREYFSNQT